MPGFYLPNHDEFDPLNNDFIAPFLTKERQYRHFDLPLSDDERTRDLDFSVERRKHRFWPLLGYTETVRKVSRDANGAVAVKQKDRPIRYASHSDAAYLEAYAAHLNKLYEAALAKDGTSESVLAYRKGGSTNIHHSKSLFDEIASRRDSKVIALDITKFFDTLDHRHLKKEILALLGQSRLSGHDWTVFDAITRYSWVETADLDERLGKKRKRQGRICHPDDFKKHVRGRGNGLVQTHKGSAGIPQGTPISGLYANIYMRTLDNLLFTLSRDLGGSYRRYSDDIAIVLPIDADPAKVIERITGVLAEFKLSISCEKTETATFQDGRLISSKAIQYLGFIFDGEKTLIRPSSVAAYQRKMKRAIHAKLIAAKVRGVPSFTVFKRDLISRYTHKGKRRNFIQYAYRSADIHQSLDIRYQVRNHIKWFNNAWDSQVEHIYGGLVASR